MEIIAHRRNLSHELLNTPVEFGIEIDLRTSGNKLIVQHDPFIDGERFEDWLKYYKHGLLILNVKEEGLEQALIDIVTRKGIERFFFFDQSMPFLVKTARSGERRCAVRVSEYESIKTALSFAGLIDWVWIDCFSKFPLNAEQIHALKAAGFRLCLVSPELQGRFDEQEVRDLRRMLAAIGSPMDAVCTKRPEIWS